MDVTPASDPEGQYPLLCEAVGYLFLQWAMLENEMAASLRNHLQRRMRNREKGYLIACSVYGSMRMKASRDTMKRIITELDCGPKALNFHQKFFAQIGHIEDLRDKLAHQFVVKANKEYDGVWHTADIVTTRSYTNFKVYEFRTEAIVSAAQDLTAAANMIGQYLPKAARRSAPQLPAWKYKPSMLKLRPRKRRPSPPTPRHRQKSSPA